MTLFTIWIGDRLPEHIAMCLRSMILSKHRVKLYVYKPYVNIPSGVELVDMAKIFPFTRIKKNKEFSRHPTTITGDSYCGIVDLLRILIMKQTDDIWIDSDIFLLKNTDEYKPNQEIIASMWSSWWGRGMSPSNGYLRLSKDNPVLTQLIVRASQLLENGDLPIMDTYASPIGIKFLQDNLYEMCVPYLASHLFVVPIAFKYKHLLLQKDYKVPVMLKESIFGIHIWNTGFLEHTNIDFSENTLLTNMHQASQARNSTTFQKEVELLFTDSYDYAKVQKDYDLSFTQSFMWTTPK